MPWFKVDDQMAFNSKVILAGNEAMGLWVRAGSWSAAQLTDGFIPSHIIAPLSGTDSGAESLVMSGLWNRTDGGYQFHDWEDYQPDATSIKSKRKGMSEGGSEGNHKRWHVARKQASDNCVYCDDAYLETLKESSSRSDRVPDSPPNPPVPSRPDPIEEAKASSNDQRVRVERVTRFDEFWNIYPRKVGKDKARTKYTAACKRADEQTIIDGAHRLANDPNLPETKYIPHPTTWLERGGWGDEALPDPWDKPKSQQRLEQGWSMMNRVSAWGPPQIEFPTNMQQEIER